MLTIQPPKTADASKPIITMPEPFVFVPITGSEAAKGRSAAKRIVRAHVTRVQHAKSSAVGSHMELQSWTVRPYIHRTHATMKRKKAAAAAPTEPESNEASSSRAIAKAKSSSANAAKSKSPPSATTPSTAIIRIRKSSNSSSTYSGSSKPNFAVPVPVLITGGSNDDPFWSFPVDYQPALSPIFAHYIQNVAVEIPDIDGPNDRGLLRRVWFPLCMTEAATMYAVLLMAASHYCIMNPSKAALIDLLAIKARALAEINAALTNPNRAVTDAMIGAVAKMAAYEAVFGDSKVFAAHMKGLQMMLKMRGGLSTLGLNGLLERMCVWIDLNACFLIGAEKFLGNEIHPTTVEFAAPDPYHFAGIQ